MHRRGWRTVLVGVTLWAVVAPTGCSKESSECTPTCTIDGCGDDGCGGSCGECEAGSICAENMCTRCGNGVLEADETCDPSAGVECSRESWCESDDACYVAVFSGDASTCDSECMTTGIVDCESGDGCCPTGCSPANDVDCAPEHCGNGVLDPGESCDSPDFPCASSCEPTNACETAEFWGFEVACSLECKRTPIVSCSGVADGCCPDGCTSANDADCDPAVCGDGVVTDDERCDSAIVWPAPGACSPDCDDNRSCTTDLINGAPATCDVICTYSSSTACIDDDGCCPRTCSEVDDTDCAAVVCGDGVVDGDEGCDSAIPAGEPGACPSDVAECDDQDPCTDDLLEGDSADCSARCVNREQSCGGGDQCCPSGCTPSNDAECEDLDLCNVYCNNALQYCTGQYELYGSRDACIIACRAMEVGKPGDASGDTIQCRIHHLVDAKTDPEGHCGHSGETPEDGCI